MKNKLSKYLLFIIFFYFLLPTSYFVQALPKNPDYPLSQAMLISRALTHIQRQYFDPQRIHPNAMFEAALKEVQKTVPEILAKCEKGKFCAVTVKQAIKRFPYPGNDLGTLKSTFKEIFQFLEQHIDKDTEKDKIEYSAIMGLLDELDPHSNFMSPDSYREFRVGTEGEFGGLGIVISIKEGALAVTAPLEGTPAWKAGVKPKDHILQIDDESTINMSLTEAVQRLRGKVGTKVTIKIERTGRKEPLLFSLTRAIINVQSVQSKLVKTPKGFDVGFVRVKNFQGNTTRDVEEQLNGLIQKSQKLKGVVLDLRNNPGGLLDQAIQLADIFLKEGVIVSTKGRNEKLLDLKKANNDGFEGNWPVIVLVNEGSASASEIVAGALKNNGQALTIGTQTFGKGSVQSIFELPMEAAIKITVGQYLTPGDQSIQSVGITPDVSLLGIVVDREHLNTIENIQTFEKDLEKHLVGGSLKVETPAFLLRYLGPTPKEEEEMEYKAELDLKNDTAGLLAVEMFDSLQSTQRDRMLKEVREVLEQKRGKEEQKIAGEFQKLGVNWETGPIQGTPQAELTYHLLKGPTEIKTAQAGEEVRLKIQLKNVGNGPFYRLAAQTESKLYPFKNLEFAFGKILPGETRSWETPIKIPVSLLSEDVFLELKFQDGGGKMPPPLNVILPIQELKRPHFAHHYQLEENAFAKLNAGKSVTLTVKVTNEGKGTSKKPLVAIRNLGNKEVFIEKGRIVLDPLAPGETKEAQFRFHFDPNAEAKKIDLSLSILDNDLIVQSEQELHLKPLERTIDPAQGKWYRPPVITLVQAKDKTSQSPTAIEGNALDDQTIRDIYIFVEDEKTYYEANLTQDPKFIFKTALPLKEGNNTVLINVRDNNNLTTQYLKVIRLDPS